MILFSEALTRFRNRGCESLEFERVNEHIEQLIQNQLFESGRKRIHPTQGDTSSPEKSVDGVSMSFAP